MHEHVFLMTSEVTQNYPDDWGSEADREADAITRLNNLKAHGVDSIVDLTVIGLGRYLPRIARIAAATEINIVVATGLYTYTDIPMTFWFRGPGTAMAGPEPMTELFVRDIEEGWPERASRPQSSSAPPTNPASPRGRAGPAGRGPGAPPDRGTDLHPYPCRHPPWPGAAAHLRRGGRRPVLVVIGHCGDTTDIGYPRS